jgi:hypothetical protein
MRVAIQRVLKCVKPRCLIGISVIAKISKLMRDTKYHYIFGEGKPPAGRLPRRIETSADPHGLFPRKERLN